MKIVNAPVGSELWIYLHVGKVSGSGFRLVMTDGKGLTRDKYLKQLIEERKTGVSSLPCQEVLQGNRGALLESEVVELYECEWDIQQTDQVVIINDDIVISPDVLNSWLFESGWSGNEIKCYGLEKHNELIEKGMPNSDRPQVQGYIGYIEADFWDYSLYHPGAKIPYKSFRIEPDFDYIQELKEKVDKFTRELKTGADLTDQLQESIKESV